MSRKVRLFRLADYSLIDCYDVFRDVIKQSNKSHNRLIKLIDYLKNGDIPSRRRNKRQIPMKHWLMRHRHQRLWESLIDWASFPRRKTRNTSKAPDREENRGQNENCDPPQVMIVQLLFIISVCIFNSYTLTERRKGTTPLPIAVEAFRNAGRERKYGKFSHLLYLRVDEGEGGLSFHEVFGIINCSCKFSGAPKSSTLHTTTLREKNTCYTLTICYKR